MESNSSMTYERLTRHGPRRIERGDWVAREEDLDNGRLVLEYYPDSAQSAADAIPPLSRGRDRFPGHCAETEVDEY